MYIAPNSIIKILKNVPLDPSFDHTIYFTSKEAQYNYFSGKAKYTLTQQSYQRLQRGFMRVDIQAENLYDCNYVMYQNTAFGDRWFYGFITKVEYINNAVSQVNFILDPMQTWFFDYELQPCFVEREHSATDVVGDNLLPEPVPISEYISESLGDLNELKDIEICIATSFEIDDSGSIPVISETGGGIYNRIYSGCDYITFPNTNAGAQAAANFLERAATLYKQDGIVNVFYIPSVFKGEKGVDMITTGFLTQKTKHQSGTIDGYTPHNKKLYTYPYNFLYVTTYQGESASYPYEFFETQTANFYVTGDMTCNPTCWLYPMNYKGVTDNWDEALTLSGWVTCTYNTDVWKAWLAQTLAKIGGMGIALAAAMPTGGLSLGMAGAIGAVGAGTALSTYVNSNVPQAHNYQNTRGYDQPITFDNVTGYMEIPPYEGMGLVPAAAIGHLLGDGIQRQITPPQQRGRQGGQAVLQMHNEINFNFYNKHIRAENLRIIDNYFDMFGYATKRLKVPNRNVRPHWCYTKTVACVITGSLPADDAKAICSIYDRGITFWKNGNEVGNYNLDNRV